MTPWPSAFSEPEYTIDVQSDESVPLVPTELVTPGAPAIVDVNDYFSNADEPIASLPDFSSSATMASIEIPIPSGILDSLPRLESPAPSQASAQATTERRSNDGLVREVSIPLNLSLDELRRHRRLRLKITLDVNLLP